MKILVVGGGGREHAICWKAKKSPLVEKIYCAPGNAGIAQVAECVNIGVMEFDKLTDFALKEGIDFTIIGPDDPLVAGIVDAFKAKGLKVFGPDKCAAIIEGSKSFSKDLMKKYGIPTAGYEVVTSADEAYKTIGKFGYPVVLKADGLALGKGVLICNNEEEAKAGVREIMEDKKFGTAGNTMVIEEFLTGPEVSVLCFSDGKTIKPMVSAQDHKRAKDNNEGLNTGGMGTFSPTPFYTEKIADYCMKNIYEPTIAAMEAEGRKFVGILFVGLMLTEKGPKVLEYNARFGDPETQVVLPRMKSDMIKVMLSCVDGTLDKTELEFDDNAALCVVMASNGYPEHYEKGFPVTVDEGFDNENTILFHAGTKFDGDKVVTNGGRVLGAVALGRDLREARDKAYAAADLVHFANKYNRTDLCKSILGD